MLIAPRPRFASTLAKAPSGRAGVFHTLKLMREAINEGKINTRILQAATSLIFLTPEKDKLAEAEKLFTFVRDNIRYMQDVHGIETLATPWLTLARGVGDCDDQTTLLGALLESAGYPTRLIMTGYTDNNYEHVYLQVCIDGEWYSCDATESQLNFGEDPGIPTISYVERV